MKRKSITEEKLLQKYKVVLKLSFTSQYFLLKHLEPDYFYKKSKGWESNIYCLDKLAISHGYAPCGNVIVRRELLEQYEQFAKNNHYLYSFKIIDKENYIKNNETILNKFINKVFELDVPRYFNKEKVLSQ